MILNQTIRKIISSLLICVFALSIAPVFFVHTLFASHIDKKNTTSSTGYQLSESGYNCKCEDFVAEGQFLNDAQSISITIPIAFSIFNETAGYTFFAQHHFYSELRGPPSLG